MAASNGHAKLPTGTSLLLPKDAVEAADGPPMVGAADEEAGEVEAPDNPIFEGLPEVAARLHILAPAVSIGVSSCFYLCGHANA